MKLIVGVNDGVWVRLTPAGVEHLLAHFQGQAYPEGYTPGMAMEDSLVTDDGWRKFQLFDLMNIFGSTMLPSHLQMFENNQLHFTQPF